MTDVIPATFRSLRMLADGTLRLTVDVEPTDTKDAMQLCGSPGTPMALARLSQESEAKRLSGQAIAKHKPTPMEVRAYQLCRDERFQNYVIAQGWRRDDGETHEDMATVYLKGTCGIEHRHELNLSDSAREKFERLNNSYLNYIKNEKWGWRYERESDETVEMGIHNES